MTNIPVRDSVADDLPECVARKWKCASVTDVVMPSAVLADNDELAEQVALKRDAVPAISGEVEAHTLQGMLA